MIEGNTHIYLNKKILFFFCEINFYRDERDRNDEIQQLIARAEYNARQYMSNFNISTSPVSTLVRIIPVASPTRIS